MVELRADYLEESELAGAGRFPGLARLPVILTLRRGRDGGKFGGTEAERVSLLRRLAGNGFSFVDIEEDLEAPLLDDAIRKAGARVVRSLYDFAGVPSGLLRRFRALARGPREVPKAAVTPTSCAQLAELLAAYDRTGASEGILIGMGDIGFPTRVLATKLGSSWCYASPTSDAVAPGHVTPMTLENEYRFRSIGRSTALYGVIGNPVMHSLSPSIHNRGFSALGIDAVYLPFLVADLDGFWKVADVLQIRGLSVTVPHKQAVLGPGVMGDELTKIVGACNTLTRGVVGGTWQGTNTDAEGFLSPLRAMFGGAIPAGLGATVIGAGGAARAVVAALTQAGARVLVLNRTPEKARSLAAAFGAEAGGLETADGSRAEGFRDLVVQTTSAGMAPYEDTNPAPGFLFAGSEIVYELVYSPQMTRFLRRAREAGCRIIYGRQMLIAQAVRQFRLFTGADYPASVLESLERAFD